MPGHEFAQADMQDVLREAKMAFALSIQSIWERQLRAYLVGCAQALQPSTFPEGKVERSNWKELRGLFRDLRGIELESFPSFDELDILQHLGNACRHGDGGSAVELSRRCADLWQPIPSLPPEFGPAPSGPPPVASMDISAARLRGFVEAIATFWMDTEYIYNESIERKHENLEAHLVRERGVRTWFPPAV
jgi:hypothetical protein